MSANPIHVCKHGEVDCGVHYDCGRCASEKRARAYQRLTHAQKLYDQHVDPAGWYHTDFPQGCSCHISAPCGYCVRDTYDQNDGGMNPVLGEHCEGSK